MSSFTCRRIGWAAAIVAVSTPSYASFRVPAAITAYWDSANSVENVIYVDNNGALIDLQYSSGSWSSHTLLAGGTYIPPSPILSFFDTGNSIGRVFFMTKHSSGSNADISALRGNPPTTTANLTVLAGGDYPDSGGFSPAYYTTHSGASLDALVTPTGLAGFEDTTSTRYHHVFYIGATAYETREFYASGSTDNDWTDHQIANLNISTGGPGLAALWDGSYSHVYVALSDTLYETYYNGSWFSNSWSGAYEPELQLGAWSQCSACEDVLGAYFHNGSQTPGAMLDFVYNSGWVGPSGVTASNNVNGCQLAYRWNDSTTGNSFLASGVDGGCFYIGSDNNLYIEPEYYQTAANISSGYQTAAPNTVGHANGVAGFYDGTNLHAFYVGDDGYVWEAYAAASSVSDTSHGSWTIHQVGGGGNAAR